MKKWLKTIMPVFALALILLIPGIQAQAGTITSLTVTAGTDAFTVSGVAEEGVLSVVIFVYDSTGTTLLQMESVAVDSSHAYTDTFAVSEGTYVVKVADYEGGAFRETSITVGLAVPVKYSVTTISGGNGTVAASVTEAEAGTTVTLTATPDSGYEFKSWTVESGSVTLTDSASATTTFTMPDANVSIKATFEQISSGTNTDNNSEDTNDDSADSDDNEEQQPSANTSDGNHLSLWGILMMGSLAALIGMTNSDVRRKNR